MLADSQRRRAPLVAQLTAHIGVPLYRNAYALMLSSAVTSGLGMLYWVAAARLYSAESVGLNSTAISAMTFLAVISQFNLTSASMRFIPTTGTATRRFVGVVYAIAVVVAAVTGLVFVAGVGLWAPSLGFLRSSPTMIAWFVLATMAWSIFVLQDGVLMGLRQALWVPVENAAFALSKIVLLLAFAGSLAQQGVFASWTIAHVLCLIPVSWLIFGRLIPRHERAVSPQVEPVAPSQVARYVAGDYLGTLCSQAAATIPPIMVLEIAGPAAAACYYVSFTFIDTLYNIGCNMGWSLVVEATRDQARLALYKRRALLQTARIVVPIVAVLFAGAPLILRIFGASFAAEGTALLRLLALSAIPYTVTALHLSEARVQRQVGAVFALLALLCVLVLTLSYVLLRTLGIVGVGWAWLAGQSIVAAAVLLAQARALRGRRHGERASLAPHAHGGSGPLREPADTNE